MLKSLAVTVAQGTLGWPGLSPFAWWLPLHGAHPLHGGSGPQKAQKQKLPVLFQSWTQMPRMSLLQKARASQPRARVWGGPHQERQSLGAIPGCGAQGGFPESWVYAHSVSWDVIESPKPLPRMEPLLGQRAGAQVLCVCTLPRCPSSREGVWHCCFSLHLLDA